MSTKRVLGFALAVASVATLRLEAQGLAPDYPDDLLGAVREAATTVPGALPDSINFLKFAESHRTYAAVIEGGSDEPFISARTAFQVVYPAGSVMIDSGMDEAVHRFYGFGREEPYWQAQNDLVQSALAQANLILVTHEHGDHVAGVLRSSQREDLTGKTLLTRAQVDTLITAPQLPEIQLTEERARDYVVIDYELYLPVAPGMVLIKAPGHTRGHQMVYVLTATGAEYLFIGDVGWTLDNVTQIKLRPPQTIQRIGEDPEALMAQLTWLNGILGDGILVVPSHDDVLLTGYGQEGLLGTTFSLD